MDNVEFSELLELTDLLESSQEDHVIRQSLRRMTLLKHLADKSRDDWIQHIQSREKEIYLLTLESDCDALGAFCDLKTLEERLNQVPQPYQNTYLFGYFRGIADYRQATEWLNEML